MNIKKLYYHYMKDNPSSSVERFRKIIFTWMGNIILNRITKEDMLILLYKLDYMEYEYGNAIAKDNVKQLAEPYQKKGINLRKAFHITSSTLYKVFNCEIIAISSALEFCKLNNLKLSDYFKIYSKKKTYTKEMKKDIKNAMKRLLDYAVEKGFIKENPMPSKHIFKIDIRRTNNYLPSKAIEDFVEALFNRKNINERCYALIFIIVGLNKEIVFDLKIKNFNFEHHFIKYNGRTFYMSEYISNLLNDFFFSELPNNKILNYNPNYLKTLIYKIGNDVNEHTFNLESLKSNYGVLMKYVNQYSKKEIKTIKYEELTKENEIAYNDFKAFLQYRKEYLG